MENNTFLFNINDYYIGTVSVRAPNADIAYDTLATVLGRFRQDPQSILIDRELELVDEWSSDSDKDTANAQEHVDFDFYEWIRNPKFESVLDNSSEGYRQFLVDTMRAYAAAINREQQEEADGASMLFCNDIY